MIRTDESALICDFAETYRIYDYKGLPARYAAVLAVGLREDSRIKMKLDGIDAVPPGILIEAIIADTLRGIAWFLMGRKNKERPTAIVDIMTGKVKPASENEQMTFKTASAYEAERSKILREIKKGGARNGD